MSGLGENTPVVVFGDGMGIVGAAGAPGSAHAAGAGVANVVGGLGEVVADPVAVGAVAAADVAVADAAVGVCTALVVVVGIGYIGHYRIGLAAHVYHPNCFGVGRLGRD